MILPVNFCISVWLSFKKYFIGQMKKLKKNPRSALKFRLQTLFKGEKDGRSRV
jgi:hypothetical protein